MQTCGRNRLLLGLLCVLLLGLVLVLDRETEATAHPSAFNRTVKETWFRGPSTVFTQDPLPRGSGTGEPTDTSPPVFTLPTDRGALRKLEAARDYLDADSWDGLRLLQSLLEAKEDAFLPAGKDVKPSLTPKSARAEAQKMIDRLSPKAMDAYEGLFGNFAIDALKTARTNHDFAATEVVVHRWFHTKAGFDAARDLAIALLDGGEPVASARYFARLLRHRLSEKLLPMELFQAAVASRLAGDADGQAKAWKRLEEKLKDKPLDVPGRGALTLAELRKTCDALESVSAGADDWRTFRGNAARTGNSKGGAPLLEPLFYAKTFSHAATKDMFYRAIAHLEQSSNPILPTFFPITVGDKLIYRSCEGIHAVDMKTLKPAWKQPAEMRLALDHLMANFNARYQLYDKVDSLGRGTVWYGWWWHYANDWEAIFENSTIGSLSADTQHVYAVDDLPVPPHPSMHAENDQRILQGIAPAYTFGALADDVQHNRLRAFKLDTGELAWEVGGKTPTGKKAPLSPLHDSFFLGPPLPLEGKLYVLNERNNEVRLVCLKPASGELLWIQPLASSSDRIAIDVGRRIHALHIAHANGVLVCPTGMGVIVAVDQQTRNLLWTYAYREQSLVTADGAPSVAPGFLGAGLKTSAPIIHEGKVIFAGCDADAVHCIDLRDGTGLWHTDRSEEDRFLAAVHKDRVLLVGRSSCRALNLKDGESLMQDGDHEWRPEIGLPSGQGVQDGRKYYLPLKQGAVAVVDLESMNQPTVIRCRTAHIPGNLLFHRGCMISQNLKGIAAYPNLEARLAEVNESLKKNPKDPVSLTERALFHLDKGELPDAIIDLRTALAQDFPKDRADVRSKAEQNLFDALTNLLQSKFAEGEKYLDEYQHLATVDIPPSATAEATNAMRDERDRRRVQLCRILANGREQQGRLGDALAASEEMYELFGDAPKLFAIDPGPVECSPRAWASQHIASMFSTKETGDRSALESLVAERWRKLESDSTLEKIERFVKLYGDACITGSRARLALAERLIAQPERDNGLAAEQHLLALLRNQSAAELHPTALDALATLMLRKGLVEDALFYYRRLASDFPKAKVHDGKMAAEILDELRLDKRFLALLAEEPPDRRKVALEATEVAGNFPLRQQGYPLNAEGDVCPSLKRIRMTLDTQASRLRVYDQQHGQELWNLPLSLDRDTIAWLQQNVGSLSQSFQVKGHLAVMNLGRLLVAVNLMDRRLLWQHSFSQQAIPNDFLLTSVGETGPIDSPYVCVQTRPALRTFDALTGNIVWTRSGITVPVDMLGDHEHLYLVKSDADGKTAMLHGASALRLSDGADQTVPDFSQPFVSGTLVQSIGRTLLINQGVRLRLYDIQTGKDLWSQRLPPRAIVVHSEIPELVGWLEARGELTLFDIKARKVVLQTKLESAHVEGVDQVNLFGDSVNYYIALHVPSDNKEVWGEPNSNVQGSMRTLPVNGHLYALNRKTGKWAWFHAVEHQHIVLEQQEDLPFLLCTCQASKVITPAQGQLGYAMTCAIDKSSGKLFYRQEIVNNGNNVQPFHSLLVDPRTGAIDFISQNRKIRFERRDVDRN